MARLGQQEEYLTARRSLGGIGLQTAGLGFGGYTTANTASTEEYNGTSLDCWWKYGNGKKRIIRLWIQTAGLLLVVK
jgi:hypothetical protein